MLSKVVSKEEALTKIHDGQTIMFGDWHGEFAADEIIDGMLEKGIKDIHAIAVSAGMPDQGVGKLIREKRVKSLVTTHIALNPLARDQMFAGELISSSAHRVHGPNVSAAAAPALAAA